MAFLVSAMTSPLSLTCTRTPAGLVAMRWFGCFLNPGPLLALIGPPCFLALACRAIALSFGVGALRRHAALRRRPAHRHVPDRGPDAAALRIELHQIEIGAREIRDVLRPK